MDALFGLATPADDAAIRQLLATSSVPGHMTLTYEREPDYFTGCRTMGHFYQVAVGRHPTDGTLLGIGCRATRPLFINGQAEEVGYLGQLRIASDYQGHWLLAQGFRYLRQLHCDGRVAGYITTIIEENEIAQGVLVERARRHFPSYRPIDRLCTLGLITARALLLPASWQRLPSGYEIGRGTRADLPEIVAFLQQQGRQKQFFPVYREQDFCDSALTPAFSIEDFVMVRRTGEIVAVGGLWDQSSYKQTVVQSYSGRLRWLGPFSMLVARLMGAAPLPMPGEHIRSAYASFLCVQDNDPHIFRLLLRVLYRLATERGYAYLVVGLTARDPLLKVAQRYPHIPYYSQLYTVCWRDEARPTLHDRLDGRIPYVEIAAL